MQARSYRLPHRRDMEKSDYEIANNVRAAAGVAAALEEIDAKFAELRKLRD